MLLSTYLIFLMTSSMSHLISSMWRYYQSDWLRNLEIWTTPIFSKVRHQTMSSTKSATTASKRSATTTPTVGPSKASSASATKKTISNKPCKLCAQDTVLAAPSVKRKGDPNILPSTSAAGTSDGRKIGENKLLSKANKNTRCGVPQNG